MNFLRSISFLNLTSDFFRNQLYSWVLDRFILLRKKQLHRQPRRWTQKLTFLKVTLFLNLFSKWCRMSFESIFEGLERPLNCAANLRCFWGLLVFDLVNCWGSLIAPSSVYWDFTSELPPLSSTMLWDWLGNMRNKRLRSMLCRLKPVKGAMKNFPSSKSASVSPPISPK